MRRLGWVIVTGLMLALGIWALEGIRPASVGSATWPNTPPPAGHEPVAHTRALPAFLPAEARRTLDQIVVDGPFAHRQDGGVFQNRERLLPHQPRGYYREFTVPTPGARDRGPRRIVSGGDPPVEFFYTDDHYRSFRRFALQPEASR